MTLFQQQQRPIEILQPDTRALMNANFAESLREYGRWQHPSQVLEKDGLLLLAGSTAFPGLMNSAIRLDSQIPAVEMIEKAQSFFGSMGRGFTLFSLGEGDRDLEAVAEKAGLLRMVDVAWMVLDRHVTEPKVPANVVIKQVTDEQGILDARHINAEAFESLDFPKAETEAIFGIPARLLSPPLAIYVAYLDGEPVSTAMTLLTPPIAGVYWVGTKPSARGHGLAEACCRYASNWGFANGATWAVLQASSMGESIYERIGYRKINEQLKGYLLSEPN